MILLDDVVQVLCVADYDGHLVFCIDGFECGQIGAALIDGRRSRLLDST